MGEKALSYQFDNLEVDVAAFVVKRDGKALDLEPKAIRVLLYLIERRERAVSKEELFQAVWEGTAVTDNALTRIVAQLRRELGDDARQARFIQTLPTLGYRFIAEAGPAPVEPKPASSHRNRALTAAVLLVVMLAGLYWWLTSHRTVAPVQLTTSPGLDIGASFSPDGSTFVYSSNRSGKFEVYLRTVRGSGGGTQISWDGQQNVDPAWSPDGKSIAYHSVAQHGIWIVPAAGGASRRLTEFGSAPAWSPDGRHIVFRSMEPFSFAWFDIAGGPTAESTIWSAASDGSELRQLTKPQTPQGLHVMPRWSPDGKRVVFVSLWTHTAIWSVDAAADHLEQLQAGDGPMRVGDAVIAPNHDLYFTGLSRAGEFGIYRMAGGKGNPVEVYNTRKESPYGLTVSRDGKQLIYTRLSNVSQIWVTGSDGQGSKPLYEDAVVRAKCPSFSPDGKRMAYVVYPEGRNPDLWMMNADGTGAQAVAADRGAEDGPSWTTDGNGILYSYAEGGHYQFRRVNPADGSRKILSDSTRKVNFLPRVMPDQSAVICSRSDPLNIWRDPFDGGAPKQLTFDREGATFPVPSWNGQWIAYELRRGVSTQLAVVDREGGHQEVLTDDPDTLNWPGSWASDNRRIAYASYRNGVWNLFWIDRVTRERKQITHYTAFGNFVRNPGWRPGSEQIAYEYSQGKGTIWALSLQP